MFVEPEMKIMHFSIEDVVTASIDYVPDENEGDIDTSNV